MVETDHPELSIVQQCTILGISRSSYYYKPKEVAEDPDLAILEPGFPNIYTNEGDSTPSAS